MPWPIPSPGDISGRAAAVFEQAFPPNPATGDPGIDARNPNTVATTYCRIVEMAVMDLYLYQGNCANETMPDTAVQNLPRFGTMWNIPRTQAAAATGNVIVTGTAETPVPEDTVFTYGSSNVTWISTTEVSIPAGQSTVSVPVAASVAGSVGNLAAGSQLTISTPVAGLTAQTGTVDSNGIANGADVETIAAWRAAILQEIRYEPAAGDYADYQKWAMEALPDVQLAACPPAACGGGVVSVVIAMTGLVAPNSTQISEVLAYIQTQRPVGATEITVYPVTLNTINVTLHLNPDTPTIRAAAEAALAISFLQDATIGGTTYKSRLDDAVSSSDGEYSHEMISPTADVAASSLFSLNVLGTVTFA